MANKNYKSEDLANYIYDKLVNNKSITNPPSISVLSDLFEVLFYSSLITEESEFIKVTVTFFNPKLSSIRNLKPADKAKWKFIPFKQKVEMDVKNLVKLSKAADPWSSSLAIYFDQNGKLWIYGLIDQALQIQSYLYYELEKKPELPGLFQSSIVDVGTLVVIKDFELLATLKHNSLITKYQDVFNFGVIFNIFEKNTFSIKEEINSFLKADFPFERLLKWEKFTGEICRNSFTRILNQVKNYHHGGAILITDEIDNLNIHYDITYSRLRTSIISYVKECIKEEIYTNRLNQGSNLALTNDLIKKIDNSKLQKDLAKTELKGTIKFISSQSCIDGLVLLNKNFDAKGFGVVITELLPPDTIYFSNTTIASEKSLVQKKSNILGTRHRSMFAYCWAYPESIGFVISQDGEVRAVRKVDDKLIVWENIKTHQYNVKNLFARLKELIEINQMEKNK